MERKIDIENKEIKSDLGKLLVITGRTGAGKDYVFSKLLEHEKFSYFKRVVTCATRSPREGETDGVDYYFISEEELFDMYKNGELVEEPVKYGGSYKATPKGEILKVASGESKIWRIDPSLAAEIAIGEFFTKNDLVQISTQTTVVFIDADKQTIEQRRKSRDKENYNPNEYMLRDKQDDELLERIGNVFENVIQNPEGENRAIEEIIKLLYNQDSQ